jgi:hypothetical protein
MSQEVHPLSRGVLTMASRCLSISVCTVCSLFWMSAWLLVSLRTKNSALAALLGHWAGFASGGPRGPDLGHAHSCCCRLLLYHS